MASIVDDIHKTTQSLRTQLVDHPVYRSIRSVSSLRLFMEHHVFAVWDFMTLLKALQRELTCVELPWVPRGDREARRLINEIVLAEESDDDGEGGHASHFELYLAAMRQLGAETGPIERFLGHLAQGRAIEEALLTAQVPDPARTFVVTTWEMVESGSIAAVASAFTIGREELIPDLFREIVTRLDHEEPARVASFRRYLDRHVELDGDEHGPMAIRMLESIVGGSRPRRQDARYAAEVALKARLSLWDGVLRAIEARDSPRRTG